MSVDVEKELVWLTHDEMLLLDGKVSISQTQEKIDKIRNARDYGKDMSFILELIKEGNSKGEITFRGGYVTCEICGARSDIVIYKSGRRRGSMNSRESKLVDGVFFTSDFISFQGRPRLGICRECYNRIKPQLDEKLKTCKFDYHKYLSDCLYRRDAQRKCYKCGEIIYESERGKSPTLMGRGLYPSICPYCKAESLSFGKSHEVTGKWRIIIIQKDKEVEK